MSIEVGVSIEVRVSTVERRSELGGGVSRDAE